MLLYAFTEEPTKQETKLTSKFHRLNNATTPYLVILPNKLFQYLSSVFMMAI